MSHQGFRSFGPITLALSWTPLSGRCLQGHHACSSQRHMVSRWIDVTCSSKISQWKRTLWYPGFDKNMINLLGNHDAGSIHLDIHCKPINNSFTQLPNQRKSSPPIRCGLWMKTNIGVILSCFKIRQLWFLSSQFCKGYMTLLCVKIESQSCEEWITIVTVTNYVWPWSLACSPPCVAMLCRRLAVSGCKELVGDYHFVRDLGPCKCRLIWCKQEW